MDMLIKLYETGASAAAGASSCALRKPIAPEHDLVAGWIARHFSAGWSSEARAAFANRPVSLFIATSSDAAPTLIGFCCYDTTARGFVGPIGVLPDARRTGIGAALLRACLTDMRNLGYAYAVAGHVGAPEFFRSAAGAIEIDGSTPGIFGGMLRP
jgi:GNAT superfamily N-acetyltransferase